MGGNNVYMMTSTTYHWSVRSICGSASSSWAVGNSGYYEGGISPQTFTTLYPGQTTCQVSNPALALLTPNPQTGDPGISSQFVNNMTGRSTNFYQSRANNLQGRLNNLQTTGQYCKGENPRRQARIKNKIVYITSCSNNPGTC